MNKRLSNLSAVTTAIIVFVVTMTFFSCSSKNDKADRLIKERMSKTLYDYASYDPIETIVTEAKASLYTDTTCWLMGNILYYLAEQAIKYGEQAKEAKEYMDIWGSPSYYSSSYSDSKYEKYKSEYLDAKANFLTAMDFCESISDTLRDKVSQLDGSKTVGWEVIHKFRCKTKGGYATICNYRFVIDKKFKQILIEEDMDSDECNEKRTVFNAFLNEDYWQIH